MDKELPIILRYFIYGKGLLAVDASTGELYCYHFDATGNTVAMTNASQAVVNQYAYTPFGEIAAKSETWAQPFTYVGQYGVFQESDNLYYMRARYYDASVGRFVSEDPAGFDGGDVNLYAYVQNNPIMEMDPSGLSKAEEITKGSYRFVKYVGDIMHGGEHWHVYARKGGELLGRLSPAGDVLTGAVPKTAIRALAKLGKIGGPIAAVVFELALPDEAGAAEDMLPANYADQFNQSSVTSVSYSESGCNNK